VPDRINEFRVLTLKAMGANAWRMSHNAPNPELLDLTDKHGMIVWDENRGFGNNSQYLQDMADLIQRDRNHPSVIYWALCNEGGCYPGGGCSLPRCGA
jgi:beta-galactosidase